MGRSLINAAQSFNIARFPTRELAMIFAERQAPFINIVRIKDANELHPEFKNAMPLSVVYQLKVKQMPTKPYALDEYGNMLPESL